MADTVFADLRRRNEQARDAAKERLSLLERQKKEEGDSLPPALEEELAVLRLLVRTPRTNGRPRVKVIDPLFHGLRDALAATNPAMGSVGDHDDGKFPGRLDAREKLMAALYGILATDNQKPHDFVWKRERAARNTLIFVSDDARFKKAVATALGEYTANAGLFENTLQPIAAQGGGIMETIQWANVVRKLRARGITASHPNLALITEEVLTDEIGVTDGAAPSSIEIDVPNLDDATDVQIVINNVKCMKIFYPSWMLEEALFYDVYDKIEELFLNQMLPISRGTAGDRIYKRWKKSTQRISKAERLNFYATCFGAAGGYPGLVNQNREFGDLWLRFVSAVSEFARKLQVDDLLRTRIPLSVNSEGVRNYAQVLGSNLSLHGYGVAYFAATELQNEINEIKDILSDEEVRLSYGARDMRQLIEQVSIYELGGARDVTRYFTMATSGAIIIAWLAKKAPDLSGQYLRPILDINVIRKPSMRQPTVRATREPTDRDLVDACEQWLAVTGTPDDRVSEFAQPIESPAMTSRPVAIPQVARDLLDTVGISAGMGGNGNGGRHALRR